MLDCSFSDYVSDCAIVFTGNNYIVHSDILASFQYSSQYTGSVWFPELNEPYSLANCFAYCELFNSHIILPASVYNTAHMFEGCIGFNQTMYIASGVNDCSGMFKDCTYFDSPVYFDGTPDWAQGMFANTSFNQNLYLPANYDVPSLTTKGQYSGILGGLNSYHGTVTYPGNHKYYAELMERGISFSGVALYDNNYAYNNAGPTPRAGALLSNTNDITHLGLVPSENTLGATVELPYYGGAVIQIQYESVNAETNVVTNNTCVWKCLNNGTLPKVDDPFD